MAATKGPPLDAVGVRCVWASQVQAVQVRTMTTLVPPASLVQLHTMTSGITVLRRKRRMVGMIRERFSCNINNISPSQQLYDMYAEKKKIIIL